MEDPLQLGKPLKGKLADLAIVKENISLKVKS